MSVIEVTRLFSISIFCEWSRRSLLAVNKEFCCFFNFLPIPNLFHMSGSQNKSLLYYKEHLTPKSYSGSNCLNYLIVCFKFRHFISNVVSCNNIEKSWRMFAIKRSRRSWPSRGPIVPHFRSPFWYLDETKRTSLIRRCLKDVFPTARGGRRIHGGSTWSPARPTCTYQAGVPCRWNW